MLIITTENYTGSDCTGTDGGSSRTLTLSNTQKTVQPGLLLYVSGLAISLTSDYTISHNDTGTVITFVNPLWDDMLIIVNYYQEATTSTEYGIKRSDIQDIITTNGSQVTLIRQTTTEDSMGGVTAVSEEEYSIWALIQDITRKDRQIHDMGLAVPGNSKAFFYHEYPDTLTGNGDISVEVGDIIEYKDEKCWRVEQIISQRQADNEEIFRVGVIKKIDLDEDS